MNISENSTQNNQSAAQSKQRWLQIITTVIFVGFIMLFAGLTLVAGNTGLISNLKPSYQESGVEGVISTLESNFNEEFFGKKAFVESHGLIQRLAGMRFIEDTDYNYSVVKDNNDQLHFISYEVKLQQVAQDIDQYKNLGTPILYIQTPVKNIEGYTELPPTIQDLSNESADNVIAYMAEHGVSALDLRQSASQELGPENLFYNTDHHWRVETAFWAVGKTVDYISENFGIELDPDDYYTNLDNYTQEYYEDFFLGSQGRRVGRFYDGLDDFTLIYPSFETSYTLTRSDVEKTGSFTEALFDTSMMATESNGMYTSLFNVYNNRYATYFGGDFDKLTVTNHNQPDAPKILLIKDSFSLPFGAFLSTMTSELTMIDLRYFDIENLADYITASDFDLVLIMYK